MKSSALVFVCPILSTILIIIMSFYPEKIINKIPSITKLFLKTDEKNKFSYKDYMPSIPTSPLDIWKLSQLEHSLTEIEKKYSKNEKQKEEQTQKIILQAKEIVKTGQMTPDILHKIPQYIEDMDKNSIMTRIKGFFSFVNIIWMLAIFGILISIIPALYFILSPLKDFFSAIWMNFLLPVIVTLYNYGFFELLGYTISLILIADGMKVNKEWGFFISLTGVGLITTLIYSSFKLHKENLSDEEEKKYNVYFGILTTISYFSLSVNLNSKLLSFFAVIVFYSLIGFYTGCFGLCYVFGFLNDDDMNRVIFISFVLMIFYIVLKLLNINNQILELYRCPIQIFGALTFFLALLIISSGFHSYKGLNYFGRQILFIVSFLVVLAFGLCLNLPSLTNTAYVFGVMFLMEKIVDLFSEIKGSIWLLILILSVALWISSLYLHKHSYIIVSLFTGK